MKKFILLLIGALVCFESVVLAQRWDEYFRFQKDQFTEAGGINPIVFTIDTLNPTKKAAFYGNFNRSYKRQANGEYTLATDSPNTVLGSTGKSAGYITFNPNFSTSTILSHCIADGIEYIGTYKSDSNAVASSSIFYLKNNVYVPETSIQFSGGTMIFPIGKNKFYITGSFFDSRNGGGQKSLYSSGIWDKSTGLLTAMSEGIGGYIQTVSVSSKDSTIVITTGSADRTYNTRVVWYGQTTYMDSLYPPTPNPDKGKFIDAYCIDKQKIYAVWKPNYDPSVYLVYALDFANKRWVQIASSNNVITSITGNGNNEVYFTGDYTQINNLPVASHVTKYTISTNTLADMPDVPWTDYSRSRLIYAGGELYFLDESELIFRTELVYILRTNNPLPVKLLTFAGQIVSKVNVLTWSTSEEQNVKHFNIERSSNGVDFASIGITVAKGNSTIKTDYRFEDKSPVIGFNFYRLKIVDSDGAFTYSPIVTLENKNDGGVPIIIPPGTSPPIAVKFAVYPNPAQDMITVRVPEGNKGFIRLVNVHGQSMRFTATTVNTTTLSVDIRQLQPGMYVLQYITEEKAQYIKMIKQ